MTIVVPVYLDLLGKIVTMVIILNSTTMYVFLSIMAMKKYAYKTDVRHNFYKQGIAVIYLLQEYVN
jgi:hypothetical protein